MRLDHLLFKKRELNKPLRGLFCEFANANVASAMCTHKGFLSCFLPCSVRESRFFEITKEGTEILSDMLKGFSNDVTIF